MKAVLRSNLRRPAGVVSQGRLMRIGRAGASGSKNVAIWNGSVASLMSGPVSGTQFGRSKAQRITNQPGSRRSSVDIAAASGSGGRRAGAVARARAAATMSSSVVPPAGGTTRARRLPDCSGKMKSGNAPAGDGVPPSVVGTVEYGVVAVSSLVRHGRMSTIALTSDRVVPPDVYAAPFIAL